MHRFLDRKDAGRRLARKLLVKAPGDDVVVLGMANGGVIVAREVATALGAPLDALFIQRLRLPDDATVVLGAVTPNGSRYLNASLIQELGLTVADVDEMAAPAAVEIRRRESSLRSEAPSLALRGKTVVLVDDGIATGTTILAAIRYLKSLAPAKIVVAVPVVPAPTLAELRSTADAVTCLATPDPFCGVANWYYDFSPVGDREVREAIRKGRYRTGPVPIRATETGTGLAKGEVDDELAPRSATNG